MKRLILAIAIFAGLVVISFCSFLPKAASSLPFKEALYWQSAGGKDVQCLMCPHKCFIPEGKRGFCGTRENHDGKLYTLTYSQLAAVHIDPIEKKPLFHFLPGTTSFSIATAGCNLRCKFCQNWEISQAKPEEIQPIVMSPAEVVEKAKESGSKSIAFTYNEPTVFYEYILEVTKLAKPAGVKCVMHSSGYINEEPLRNLCKYIDAANIDLKGFTNKYYNDMCMGDLDDVLRSLKILRQEGVHLEITNLLIPNYNDSPENIEKMCLWIKENLGEQTPLHFSRFWPMYKLVNLSPTPIETLEMARNIALKAGLKYVYIGNVPGNSGETTYCPKCGKALVKRAGYTIIENYIVNGCCKFCNQKIEGFWQET